MILLDTNVCISYLHGNRRIVERLLAAYDDDSIDSVEVPGMVVGELYYGVEKSARRDENREKTEHLLTLLPVCHVNDTVMRKFGELKALLEKGGVRVDDADVLIAATAICNDATLVTGNVKHFSRFPGLKIENWLD